jgi:HlyD family secretion protein
MRQRRTSRRSGLTAILIVGLGALATVGFTWANGKWHHSVPPGEKYELADVRRTDLFPAHTASGRVESSKRTLIECELENITIGIMGQRFTAGGASVLLSVVPEGSYVQKGDVLAVLDSSDYEELLRQQRMTVERSKADHHQAQLNHEIARLAVTEFQEGLKKETIKDFERSIAVARADQERTRDRMEWARRMKQKGYVPLAQVSNEELNNARALFALGQERAAYELFLRWTAPRTIKVLEGDVLAAEATLRYQDLRLSRNLDRLAKLEKQVELCTIRAPHDGFVIYANDERRDVRIEEGMAVRQKQDLFYLPDLTDMEVVAYLHESMVNEIANGMRAKVKVEGLPDRKLEGHVTSVAAIPTFNWRSDVRYFDGKVKLDSAPKGIRPGMTAQVEIELNRKSDVLAVPTEAIAHEGGHEFCYVVHEDGLERREVKLGEGTPDMLEISMGLHEGEQVVLNPVASEVESDTSTETPLLSEATFTEQSPATAPDEPAHAIASLR